MSRRNPRCEGDRGGRGRVGGDVLAQIHALELGADQNAAPLDDVDDARALGFVS